VEALLKSLNLIAVMALPAIFVMQLWFLWAGTPDAGLHTAYTTGAMPIPYGVLWTWLNPMWLVENTYKIYLSVFIASLTVLEGFLVMTNRIPFFIAIGNGIQNIVWFSVGGFQQITTTAFLALSFWSPFFFLGWLFQKLPLGWSLIPWTSANWQCDFGDKYVYANVHGTNYQMCGPNLLFGSPGLIFWHSMELMWVAGVAIYWVWRWLK
jgi:hypothetical protein